jgi:basic membrane protein A
VMDDSEPSAGGRFFYRVRPKVMGKKAALFFLALSLLALSRCGGSGREVDCFEVAVVMDAGGLGDKGKNDMVWRGCQRFAEEGGVFTGVCNYEPATEAEGRACLDEASARGVDVVVVASPVWEGYVHGLAKKYPDVNYLIVGGGKGAPNVAALSFSVFEAGFLTGVAAAAAVPAGSYGFLGGRRDPITEGLAAGYRDGVLSENASAHVATAYLGDDFAAPTARDRARALAGEQFEGGAAVIFAAAGRANADVAAVAKERNRLVIGCDSNQNYLEPGYVITSLNIRWDDVVFEELSVAADGAFKGGASEIDITSKHISYPIDDNNRSLIPAEAVRKIEAARERLAARAAN